MAAESSLTGFNISDLLTRLIPGTVLPISFSLLFIGVEPFMINNIQSGHVVVFLIFSFVVGEVINTFRVYLFNVPPYFRRILYTSTQDERYLGPLDSQMLKLSSESVDAHSLFHYSDKNIIDTIRQRFDLDDSFQNSANIYKLLISDISREMTQRTRRLENIFVFYQNVKISVGFSITFNMTVAIAAFLGYGNLTTSEGATAALITMSLSMGLYLIFVLFGSIIPTGRVYVGSLLSDYLTYIKKES